MKFSKLFSLEMISMLVKSMAVFELFFVSGGSVM